MRDLKLDRLSASGLIAPAILALALAACGGGGATTSPAGPDGTAAASDAPASQAATEEPGGEPTDGPAATQNGGGGDAGEACDLASPDEVGGVVGESGMTIGMNTPGDVSYCIYQTAAGDAFVATSWMKRGGGGSFSIWKSGAGVEDVDGLGDDAVFDPSSATLLVLQGDAIVSITAGDGTVAEDQRLDWSKAIAEIALGRL